VKIDDPNITMEEYIRLEKEKACRSGKVYNRETATYGKIWCNEDVHDLRSVETEFPAIFYKDALTSEVALSCEPTVNMPSFPSSEPTVSYFDDFDYFKNFEKEFTTIAYNDALTYKLDFSEPTVSPQHIDGFIKHHCSNMMVRNKTLYTLMIFPFNVIYPDDLSDKDNDNDKIDIEQS
ncbi:hypothetical protein Tco_0481562, partial [Tanacetum coccineum]